MVLEVQVTIECSVDTSNGAPTSTGTSWRHASPEFDGLSDGTVAASLTSAEDVIGDACPLDETTGSADDTDSVGCAAICAGPSRVISIPSALNGNIPARRNALEAVVRVATLVHAVLKTAGKSRFESTTPMLSICQLFTAAIQEDFNGEKARYLQPALNG